MLYADFASILKQEDDKQQDTMNQIKTEQKGQTASTHMPSGWCVHSALAYIDVLHSMKTYHGKECVEMFVEHIWKWGKGVLCVISKATNDRDSWWTWKGTPKGNMKKQKKVTSLLKSLTLRTET